MLSSCSPVNIDRRVSFGRYSVAMTKSLLYRWFGIGRMPADLKAALTSEGLIVFDEGVKSSVTYRDFRAPGKYFLLRRTAFAGCVALTKVRLVGLENGKYAINVPLTDQRIRRITFSIEGDGALVILFDANLFHNNWSGSITYRFHTDVAKDLLDRLRELSLSN